MELDPESGLVKEVFEDGAAQKAGVQAGWVFQTVAGNWVAARGFKLP